MARRNHAQYYVLDFGSAAKITLFASDVEKGQDGLFQQPASAQLDQRAFVATFKRSPTTRLSNSRISVARAFKAASTSAGNSASSRAAPAARACFNCATISAGIWDTSISISIGLSCATALDNVF